MIFAGQLDITEENRTMSYKEGYKVYKLYSVLHFLLIQSASCSLYTMIDSRAITNAINKQLLPYYTSRIIDAPVPVVAGVTGASRPI